MNKCFSSFIILAIITFLISNTSALVSPGRRVSTQGRVSSSLQAGAGAGATTLSPDAPAVARPARIIDPSKQHSNERRDKTEDLWEVRVYNDEVNTHEWVARCLVVVAGASEWQAYLTTKQAHLEGHAFLGLYEKEIAEVYTEGLQAQGIVVKMFPVGDFQ